MSLLRQLVNLKLPAKACAQECTVLDITLLITLSSLGMQAGLSKDLQQVSENGESSKGIFFFFFFNHDSTTKTACEWYKEDTSGHKRAHPCKYCITLHAGKAWER